MKKFQLMLGFIIMCFFSHAQTPYYYYYEGKKQYLSLNTGCAFLSLKEQQIPVDIKQRKVKIKELKSDKFVSDPTEIVSLHQHVQVKVIGIDSERKRIQLSLKING